MTIVYALPTEKWKSRWFLWSFRCTPRHTGIVFAQSIYISGRTIADLQIMGLRTFTRKRLRTRKILGETGKWSKSGHVDETKVGFPSGLHCLGCGSNVTIASSPWVCLKTNYDSTFLFDSFRAQWCLSLLVFIGTIVSFSKESSALASGRLQEYPDARFHSVLASEADCA